MALLESLARRVRGKVGTIVVGDRAARREAILDHAGGHPLGSPREHLDAALDWLVRAHDATPDDGVARAYSVAWNAYFGGSGWQASYPETTGYIIPTFFDAAAVLGRPELRERAIRMATWEIEVQLESGAVQGGMLGEQATPSPAVFNTGQVILGWVRAWRETGDERFLESAQRAGEFLVDCQDERGRFCRGQSEFTRSDTTTYNTRVAWSLCLLGEAADQSSFTVAGRRNIEIALKAQLENGWFEQNCLNDPDLPLLHTIAYATRGILEAGLLLDEEPFIEAARRTVRALADVQRDDGGLAGRFSSAWASAVDWSCLTGDAQTAILWLKLADRDGDPELRSSARRLCEFVMRSQNRSAADPGLAGGIKGSFPFDGDYGRFELLNWAAKFFVDAMLLAYPTGEEP
jgi:uncharacterized protein YyaL (SSP411 family)